VLLGIVTENDVKTAEVRAALEEFRVNEDRADVDAKTDGPLTPPIFARLTPLGASRLFRSALLLAIEF